MQKNTPNPASFAFDQKSPAKNGKLRRRPLRAKSLSSLESRKQSPKRSSKLLSEKRGPPWACLFSLSILVAIIVIMFSSVFLVSAPRRKMPRADSSAPENTQAHYPVIIIPGLLGSGLEIWKSDVCTGSSFRAKIWGSAAMIKQAVIDSDCLFRHLSLNYTTGLDPDGVKVRASFGLEGADFLMGIYWIFQPLIEELASIGYDPNNMFVALYDWRMSAQNMEIRDHFFTKLKSTIEIAYKTSVGRKVVICAHSYGALVFYQFLNWVQSSIGGRANAHWVETHIHAFVNIAGPLLGVPKSLSTLMSADMKNTAELLAPFQYLKDKVWGRSMLVKLFRSWGSISDMLPKGGIRIWGNTESAPDDFPDKSSFGTMLRFTHSQPVNEAAEDRCQGPSSEYNLESVESFTDNVKDVTKKQSLNVDESLDLLREIAPNFMNKVDNSTSFGLADKDFEISNAPKYWSNPLKSQLPRAPSMKIYCFYGVNKTTERSYNYQPRQGGSCSRVPFQIDTNSEGNGVICSNGDGTVPLLSLGFVCAGAWKHRRFNPAGIPVVTKEYLHDPRDLFGGGDLRGGPTSGDHVDILGNHELIEDILQIVSNSQRPPKTRIISEISTIVKNIDLN